MYVPGRVSFENSFLILKVLSMLFRGMLTFFTTGAALGWVVGAAGVDWRTFASSDAVGPSGSEEARRPVAGVSGVAVVAAVAVLGTGWAAPLPPSPAPAPAPAPAWASSPTPAALMAAK